MSIKTHWHLTLSVTWGLIVIAELALFVSLYFMKRMPQVWLIYVAFLGIIVLIQYLAKLVFQAIPAECPLCHGKSYRTAMKPVTFTCHTCQYQHNMQVNLGWGLGAIPTGSPVFGTVTCPQCGTKGAVKGTQCAQCGFHFSHYTPKDSRSHITE